jgi:L-galactono-1,4-lactone dehydrogenase
MRRTSTAVRALARATWNDGITPAVNATTSKGWVGHQQRVAAATLFDATRRDGGVRTLATSSKPYAVLGGHAAARRAGANGQGAGKAGGGDGRKASGKTSWSGRARVALFGAALAYVVATHLSETDEGEEESETATVENWSGTKKVECERMVTPETTEELVRALESAKRKKMRPVGSALSPNGCAFEGKGMVSMGLLDKVVSVDAEKKTVTLQAGARVREVVEALRPHGLTLQNYASIREQQMGGFTQVGAHGTGAAIPPVDDTVVEMKIVSPSRGLVTLSAEKEPELFKLAKCGIGALGVVAELTIQCVDAHKLVEHTWTATPSEIESKHEGWLREHQHIRYMWIPHTDTVVVVASNPLKPGEREPRIKSGYSEKKRAEPLVRLLREVAPNVNPANMGFGQLRDELLKVNPLDVEHVKRVNAAEAEFWKRSKGMRVDWSDQILGFDCGGQQHVLEVAFPAGELESERSADAPLREDLQFMRELRDMIEEKQIPAHAPIEQRWTSGSSSPMSPAAGSLQSLHSWVGIIMYLPTTVESEREAITQAFTRYGEQEFDKLGDKYKLRTHWAKIELPEDANRLATLRRQIREHYPVKEFNAARKYMDPYGILSNELIAGLFKN